jgi:hypothetical protein
MKIGDLSLCLYSAYKLTVVNRAAFLRVVVIV